MTIITDYPLWFVIFCFATGIAYAGVLYYRNNKLGEMSVLLIRLLSIFRFATVTLLSFLLLSPLLKTINRKLEKPLIIVAQDNSESIVLGKDSVFYQTEYLKKLQLMMDELSNKYEINLYTFADKIKKVNTADSIKFNAKQSDMSDFFKEMESRYSNRNIGAIIFASDGIYNTGSNPVYASDKIKVPIYTIALGDTTIKKDIVLLKVDHNRLAYLGNKFPLEVVVNAKQLKGKSTTLSISKGQDIVFTQTVNFNSDDFFETVPVLLEAKDVGLQRYKIKLSELSEESSKFNNARNVFVDVLDARQKILILSNAPHPDVAAIKESIEANQNYEVESYTVNNFDKSIKKYNLIILHQIPNYTAPQIKIVNDIKAANIPVWIFSGANTIIRNDLSISENTQKTNESEPVLEPNFPLFTLSEELRKGIINFPAIVSPYGNYPNVNGENILFYQRLGIVETKTPMMAFNSNIENKIAVFNGEGIWKWHMQDFAAHNNHHLFDEFVSKTVQYLSVKVDKSFFKIIIPTSFLENESIVFEAEVYNDSYELINEPEISILISDSEGKKFPFSFSKTNNGYRLNAGMMPVGDYGFEAKVKVGGKMYTQKGEFSIVALQVESINTIADHQLLYSIALKHDGELVYPSELEKLVTKLNSRDDIKTISYTENKLSDLIHLKWIFFLLIALLSMEWFIRKRNGAY